MCYYLYKYTHQSMGPVQRAIQYASKYDILDSILKVVEEKYKTGHGQS